ncbi:hypothetical protein AB1Y20_002203 [Prymnesium parvum]|uniref:Uncharacterized protein n=1 Tax=Prymnesium parvum TaxID=97485 RepID=A0AB34JAF3_PRYPA
MLGSILDEVTMMVDKLMVIPPVIWKTGPVEEASLLPHTRAYLRTLAQLNPGYSVHYFSDRAARHFLDENFAHAPQILRAYDALIPGAFRADLFRYCLLWLRGGVYGDLKQRYLVPLDAIVDRRKDELVTVRDEEHGGVQGIQVSFIAAAPGLPVFWTAICRVVQNVERREYGASFLAVTGPALFLQALDCHPEQQYKQDLRQSGPHVIVLDVLTEGRSRPSKAVIHTKSLVETSIDSGSYAILWKEHAIFRTSSELLEETCQNAAGFKITMGPWIERRHTYELIGVASFVVVATLVLHRLVAT